MDILSFLNPELQTEVEGNSTIRSENMSFANIKMHLHGMLTMWKERARDTMCSMQVIHVVKSKLIGVAYYYYFSGRPLCS